MEKRKANRIKIDIGAEIQHDGQRYDVQIQDISLAGMFVKTRDPIVPEHDVDVKFNLPGETFKLAIELRGTVVRKDISGLAIEFHESSYEGLSNLKNVINLFYFDNEQFKNQDVDV